MRKSWTNYKGNDKRSLQGVYNQKLRPLRILMYINMFFLSHDLRLVLNILKYFS